MIGSLHVAFRLAFCTMVLHSSIGSPSFVGENYYCESGNLDDKLWDGQMCEGSCCTGTKSPPWFSVQFPAPTNDMMEVRICGNESTDNEDNPIELIELYINKYN